MYQAALQLTRRVVSLTDLYIVHDNIFVPGPAQGAAIMTKLEEALLLWSLG